MGDRFKKYFRVWWMLTSITTQVAFQTRFGATIFLVAKSLRFFFFLFFLWLLTSKTNVILGYSFHQIVFFFATFNFIDSLAQFFLREVYRFRSYVVQGFFDFILVKPSSALFRSLFGGSDVLDLPILALSLGFILYSAQFIGSITFGSILLFIALLINAFFIALSFHIFVLSLGILTTEVDSTILLYRDLVQMGRVPVDIYQEPLRGLLTFVIPVAITTTIPAKALMGLLSLNIIGISLAFSVAFLFLSISFWKYSLRYYQSASS